MLNLARARTAVSLSLGVGEEARLCSNFQTCVLAAWVRKYTQNLTLTGGMR